MADNLDDGEFWLPSHFLTDDDILMDFNNGGSISDPDTSTGSVTESDEDELVSWLTRSTLGKPNVSSKGLVLSRSPKSTLCGCSCNQGSSRGSPNGTVSPPVAAKESNLNDATWDLLYKAAGEVARIKMRSEASSAGTGFFDCGTKGLFFPAPQKPTPLPPAIYSQPQFRHFPHLQQLRKQQQMMSQQVKYPNSPLGFSSCVWPPLQGHNNGVPAMYLGQPLPKRECAGTGVFLPRRVAAPTESRKKREASPVRVRSGGKSSQHHHQQQQHRSSRPLVPNRHDIQLPQEWIY